jgi:hypothetical protein
MKNILHIVAAYVSADYELTPENLCVVNVRGQETKYVTIDEVINNFANNPFVSGCGGIIHTYIFNTETRKLNFINQ